MIPGDEIKELMEYDEDDSSIVYDDDCPESTPLMLKTFEEAARQRDIRKAVDYYMSLHYPMVVIEEVDGGYTAYFPDLPGCITMGKTPDELFMNANDAKKCWLKAAIEDEYKISEPSDNLFL